MAPKPKKRYTRMHAAIDAMHPLGFSPKTVQATVKSLLKEYGGDDSWPFIESDAYSILISSMLEEQEEANENKISSVGDNSQEACREGVDTGKGTTECGGTDAGASKLAFSRVCSKDTGSHALQIVRNAESSQEKVVDTPPISSQAPKSPTFAFVKTFKPKSENLNGWLIEDDDEDDDNGSDLVKLNLARNLARLKRKHSDL